MSSDSSEGPENEALNSKPTLPRIAGIPFRYNIVAGLLIRLLIIAWVDVYECDLEVPYTDVDYKVYTDAARHVLNGESPYKQHTYRYSPIIAYLVIPNLILGLSFGKVLFSVFDILVTVAIKYFVECQLSTKSQLLAAHIANVSALHWLYNAFSIVISTRGNADSVHCFAIMLSLIFLQTNLVKSSFKYVLSGIFLGIAIHLRLYPLAFSFPMYISLGEYKITRSTSFKDGLSALMPNAKQLLLVFSCITSIFLITYGMYLLYGYQFLFETYIYHLFRKDTRHNFSVLFYYSYITADHLSFDVVKWIVRSLEVLLLFAIGLTFGREPRSVPFAMFSQALVMVAFNSVVTSQYFVWFLSLMPLVVHCFNISLLRTIIMMSAWVGVQGLWLFYAFLLEFRGQQAFVALWMKCLLLFSTNIVMLSYIIHHYIPDYGFGWIDRKKDN